MATASTQLKSADKAAAIAAYLGLRLSDDVEVRARQFDDALIAYTGTKFWHLTEEPTDRRQRQMASQKRAYARKALACGRAIGKPGNPVDPRTEEEWREFYRVRGEKYRQKNRETVRAYKRDYEKKRAAENALVKGRAPGKVGRPKLLTEEERRAKRRAKTSRYYHAHPEVLEKAKAREKAKRAGTFVSRALPRLSAEEKRVDNVVWSQLRRTRMRANGGKHTRADIFALLAEQAGVCAMCTKPFGEDGYHVDHKIPICKGGTNDRSNLQLLHPACNLTKGAVAPDPTGAP